jgi:hypothetical protein
MKEISLAAPSTRWRWLALYLLTAVILGSVAQAQNSIFAIQPSPSPSAAGNTLNGVAAISANDVWAVGYKNSNNLNEARTLTLHWDGVAWSALTSPNPGRCQQGNFGNVLTSVATVSTTDVWAVGFFFGCDAQLQPLAMHWDGTRWKVVSTAALPFNNNALNGVQALAADNVYAVGYQTAANGGTATLIEHWDGKAWTVVTSPNRNQTGNVLSAVSASSPTDIWAVGNAVAPDVPVKTLVVHFDGVTWKLVKSPNPLPIGNLNQNVLMGVQAISPTNATAVGYILDSSGLRELTMTQHWNGTKWKVVPSPNVDDNPGSFNTFRGVAAVSATDLYAVGFFANGNTGGQQETLIEHFDGSAWTIVPSPTKGLAQQLNAVVGLAGTPNVWSVGAWAKNGTDPEDGFLILPRSLVLFSPIG